MSDAAPETKPEIPPPAKKYSKGYIPDPAGHRVTSARVRFGLVKIEETPDSASMKDVAPPIMDQADTGSCTGHATAFGVATQLAAAGTPLAEPPSPVEIYQLARAMDRVPDASGNLPPLTDDGAQPNQAMRALSEWGTVPFSEYGPARSATINAEPNVGELEDASETKFEGYYALDPSAPDFEALLRAAIAAKHPVCFATRADDAFMNWSPATGPIGASDGQPTDHYLCAIGYETVNGETIVEFANSWGKDNTTPSGGWGDAGYGKGNMSFVRGWTNVYVMNVKKAA